MPTGLGGIIYGGEGLGKTSIGLRFPPPVTCVSILETGYSDLAIANKLPPHTRNIDTKSFQNLLNIIDDIDEGTILLDGLSGIEKILTTYVTDKEFNGSSEAYLDFYKGPRKRAPIYVQNLLEKIQEKRQAGVHVILLGHTKLDDTVNTLGADHLTNKLALDEGIREVFTQWASFVFFLNLHIAITIGTEFNKQKLVTEGKAKDDDNRVIFTSLAPGHSAKNRWDLPTVISMGSNADEAFKNMWKHFPEVYRNSYSPKE